MYNMWFESQWENWILGKEHSSGSKICWARILPFPIANCADCIKYSGYDLNLRWNSSIFAARQLGIVFLLLPQRQWVFAGHSQIEYRWWTPVCLVHTYSTLHQLDTNVCSAFVLLCNEEVVKAIFCCGVSSTCKPLTAHTGMASLVEL